MIIIKNKAKDSSKYLFFTKILKNGLDLNSGISLTQAETLLNIANNSLVLSRVSIYNNTSGIYTVAQILDDTYAAMLKQLKPMKIFLKKMVQLR